MGYHSAVALALNANGVQVLNKMLEDKNPSVRKHFDTHSKLVNYEDGGKLFFWSKVRNYHLTRLGQFLDELTEELDDENFRFCCFDPDSSYEATDYGSMEHASCLCVERSFGFFEPDLNRKPVKYHMALGKKIKNAYMLRFKCPKCKHEELKLYFVGSVLLNPERPVLCSMVCDGTGLDLKSIDLILDSATCTCCGLKVALDIDKLLDEAKGVHIE